MKEFKLDVKTTLLLSFGFFASSMAWGLYNNFVPKLLEGFLSSTTLIGFVMVIDNIFGVVFQPLFGKISDNTRTRFGRRMQFIIIGLPICAVLFAVIPFMSNLYMANVFPLMAVLILFTFVMSIWRSPVIAIMPDLTPGPLRSQANGIVNLMGGIGAIIAFLAGGILFNFWLGKTGDGYPLPFIFVSVMMILALVVMMIFVREPKNAYEAEDKTKTVKVKLEKNEKKSLVLILLGIFLWFAGYNAMETFFSLYYTNTFAGTSAGDSSITLTIFSLTFLAFAVPAGFIGAKTGRRKAILMGLTGLIVLFLPLAFAANIWLTRACLFFGGFCWAMVNVNSLPMIVRLSGETKIGTFVGYYYTFSFSSQIVSPILFGAIRDFVGHYKILFLYACIAFALAMISLFFVRHGEDQKEVTTATEVLDGLGD